MEKCPGDRRPEGFRKALYVAPNSRTEPRENNRNIFAITGLRLRCRRLSAGSLTPGRLAWKRGSKLARLKAGGGHLPFRIAKTDRREHRQYDRPGSHEKKLRFEGVR